MESLARVCAKVAAVGNGASLSETTEVLALAPTAPWAIKDSLQKNTQDLMDQMIHFQVCRESQDLAP